MIETKLKYLKSKILFFAVSTLIIIILGLFHLTDLIKNKAFLIHKMNNLKLEIANEKTNLIAVNTQIEDYQNAKKIWENINYIKKDKMGIDLQKAKLLIEDLKEIYKFSDDIKITITPPKELEEIYFYNNKILVCTELNLESKSFTDECFFGFIDAFERNFPGFIHFRYMQLKKLEDLTDKVLSDIKSSQYKYLVEGELKFEWHDFKDIN